ncbi:MAG TPA: sigma-54-dependent Fis family transcriptional regulator [Rectinemataceae bacterium]|nr:sigma-54-dependent Fis family transcriptional regulator [Rectinemataceae bacterium]
MVPDRNADRSYIERGSRRSADYGIEPERVFSRRILEGAELAERLARRKDLIVAAEPFVAGLYGFLRGSGFFAILTDDEGCILSVLGDENILAEAFALRMVPGAFMDESNIGTNAMGTALAEGHPVQVSGHEHFIKAYHRWTCSGAPIRDAEGRIVGSLDLTGSRDEVHLHTLGMVVAAVSAIEKTLALNARNEALLEQRRFTETLLDSIAAGILSADLEGRILTANSQAPEMFGYSREELLALGMDALLPGWNEVRLACVEGRPFANDDVRVDVRSNRLYFNLATYPILDRNGRPEAIILVFKDVKRVRKHANEIMGRKAIYTFDKIIGQSRALSEAVAFAKKVADSRSTILITGESGTGKEIFAQAIQNASARRDEAFVVLNCGAIPSTLIESELFGYAEGAFTGARRGGQPGKFEIADGGTLFLDEIGEMPLELQVRLLRVIEEGTITRVGDSREIPVDVRIIAASNKDLKEEVSRGLFRMDLFYRLNVLPIHLPALRERRDDIPLLVDFYMKKLSRKLNKKPVTIGDDYLARLVAQDWPGNIRELENMLELIINSEVLPSLGTPAEPQGEGEGDTEGKEQSEGRAAGRDIAPSAGRGAGTDGADAAARPARAPTLLAAEEETVRAALRDAGNNISLAARRLGIGRNTLYRKMERFGIVCSETEQRSVMEQAAQVKVS